MSTRRKPPSRKPAGHRAVSTGIKVEAAHKHNADVPETADGEHLWSMFGGWRLTPSTAHEVAMDGGRAHLDLENLMTLVGPGCFKCEQAYSPDLATQPCPGEPQEEAQ